jgi:hypothetical protein
VHADEHRHRLIDGAPELHGVLVHHVSRQHHRLEFVALINLATRRFGLEHAKVDATEPHHGAKIGNQSLV